MGVSSEKLFVIHFETPTWCNSNQGCKNHTQFKLHQELHSKMSLATPECKLTGFLASSAYLAKLTSNSEFILSKMKQTRCVNCLSRECGRHNDRRARLAPQSRVEEKNDDQVEEKLATRPPTNKTLTSLLLF